MIILKITDPFDQIALFLTILFVWIVAIITIILAKRNQRLLKTVIAEYNPPDGISPTMASFLITSGAYNTGGIFEKVNTSMIQMAIFIRLYEAGILSKLNISKDVSLEYEISPDYKNIECSEEEKIFLYLLIQHVGMKGILTIKEVKKEKDYIAGYEQLKSLWFDFYDILYKIAFERGYIKGVNLPAKIIPFISVPATFGLFFAIIFSTFIPKIGEWIGLLLLLPLVFIFFIFKIIITLIFNNVDSFPIVFKYLAAFLNLFSIVVVFICLFSWIVIFGLFSNRAYIIYTDSGKEILRKLNGYKLFLEKVNRHRLSIGDPLGGDYQRELTSLSWLIVFGIFKDIHFEQWLTYLNSLKNKIQE